jgi:predicted ATPase/predicted negative regulator of RcsB-dependent stress response
MSAFNTVVMQTPSIPRPSTSFVGRQAELSELDRLIGESSSRLVTIAGPPGIGKTRLALRYLERNQGARAGAAYFVDLTAARSLDNLCASLAGLLGVGLTQSDEMVTRVGHALSARGRMLLVLDNFEQLVVTGTAAVKAWLELAREATFIVTSREVLRLSRESVFELGPLPLPDLDDLSPQSLQGANATQLLLARVPDLVISEQNARAVAEILIGLEGIPLAIELCAARLSTLGTAGVMARMGQRLDLLNRGPRDRDARQRTLRGAIDWSWELLEGDEQLALCACSVFAGSFDARAFEAVCGEMLTGPTLDVLSSLREKSLLRAFADDDSDAELRLGLYESIRAYAAEKLRESPQRKSLERRHAAYFADFGSLWCESEHTENEAITLELIRLELDNMLIAFERTQQDETEPALLAQLLLALEPMLRVHGPFERFQQFLGRTITSLDATSVSVELKARVLRARARLRKQRGEMPNSLLDLEAAYDLSVHGTEQTLSAALLSDIGELELERGQFESARERFTQALSKLSDRALREIARAREGLGLVAHGQGQLEAALGHYEQALRDALSGTDFRLQASIFKDIGSLRLQQGRLQEARTNYTRAVSLLDELDDPVLAAVVEANLGILAQEQASHTEALTYFLSAERKLRRSGARLLEAHVSGYLGAYYHEVGQIDQAAERYASSLHVLREFGDRRQEGLFTALLAAAHAQRGELEAAREGFVSAEKVLQAVGDPGLLSAFELLTAHLALAQSKHAQVKQDIALSHAERARAVAIANAARARCDRGEFAHSDDARFALRLLEAALKTAAWIFDLHAGEVRTPEGEIIALHTRPQLQRILKVLAERRLALPGQAVTQQELLDAGWPSERMQPAAAMNRMKVALSTLRKLGLRELLQRTEHGYFLDPKVDLALERSAPNDP